MESTKTKITKSPQKSAETTQFQDIALATYLICKGHQMISDPKPGENGRRFIFTFSKTEELKRDVLDYFNRRGSVAPLQFSETLRNLKSLVW
jgi:hypothetical protein